LEINELKWILFKRKKNFTEEGHAFPFKVFITINLPAFSIIDINRAVAQKAIIYIIRTSSKVTIGAKERNSTHFEP
jgi:hypothetical protein